MFQAFQDADEPVVEHRNTFRIVSLLIGLIVFVGIVALLLR
jgi:flagellar biogenesis protein FliO